MSNEGFSARLRAAQKAGSLTTSGLMRWFNRPYPTVRKWLENEDREPWGPAGEQAHRLLAKLEYLIKHRKGLPIPVELSPRDRIQHLAGVMRARIPNSGIAS